MNWSCTSDPACNQIPFRRKYSQFRSQINYDCYLIQGNHPHIIPLIRYVKEFYLKTTLLAFACLSNLGKSLGANPKFESVQYAAALIFMSPMGIEIRRKGQLDWLDLN